jgi:hypothetical protein
VTLAQLWEAAFYVLVGLLTLNVAALAVYVVRADLRKPDEPWL